MKLSPREMRGSPKLSTGFMIGESWGKRVLSTSTEGLFESVYSVDCTDEFQADILFPF